jgi:MinD-like ATPase involved in chromosome partitioning or flagellar assembly
MQKMGADSGPAIEERGATDRRRLLPHVIAITSGKGGVGKSSIAVNLGISLAKTGARVCIFDADTGLANVNILLGLTPQFSLEHVLFGAKTIEEVMLEGPHGVRIIPGANGISECVSLHPRQQLRLTRELARIEGDFDYLLLDTAAGIADTTLDFVGAAHQVMVVITPEPTSLTDAFSLIKLMQRRRQGLRYQVVVNMCSNAAQAREVYHRFSAAVEKYIGIKIGYLGLLLRDESLRVAVSLQSPVALFPDSDPSCRGFIRLAEALEQTLADDRPALAFSGYWHRQFRQQRTPAQPGARAELAAPEPVDQRAYLAELQARLLLLLESPAAPRAELAQLLTAALDIYTQRFGAPPLDLLEWVERLTSAPQRDDDLLRQLAARLSPWQAEPMPTPAVPAVPAVSTAITTETPIPIPVVAEPVSAAIDPPAGQPAAAANDATGTHRYDQRRFGSQQALLELLRQAETGRSARELIEVF